MGRGPWKSRMEIPWQRERVIIILCLVAHGFRKLQEIADMLWLQSRSAMLECWIRPMIEAGLLSKDGRGAGTLAMTEQGKAMLGGYAIVWKKGRPKQAMEVGEFYG